MRWRMRVRMSDVCLALFMLTIFSLVFKLQLMTAIGIRPRLKVSRAQSLEIKIRTLNEIPNEQPPPRSTKKAVDDPWLLKDIVHRSNLDLRLNNHDLESAAEVERSRADPTSVDAVPFIPDIKGPYRNHSIKFTKKLNALRDMLLITKNSSEFVPLSPANKVVKYRGGLPEFWSEISEIPWIRSVLMYLSPHYIVPDRTKLIGRIENQPWPREELYQMYTDDFVTCESHKNVFSSSCDNHENLAITKIAIDPGDAAYGDYFQRWSTVGVSVFRDGVVNADGYVRARDVYIIPAMCAYRLPKPESFSGYRAYPNYPELLVLSQFTGRKFLHWSLEILPRIVPYVDFLLQNPAVFVHTPPVYTLELQELALLGISKGRLVHGPVTAGVVYLPQGGECGEKANPLTIPIISDHLLKYRPPEVHRGTPPEPETIVYIRAHERRLREQKRVEGFLREAAERRGLQMEVHQCGEGYTAADITRVFRRARLIVGPQCECLTNILWVEPPASVVEVSCAISQRGVASVNFAPLSRTLGHRHFTVKSDVMCNVRDMIVDMEKLTNVIQFVFDNYLP